MAEVFGFQFDGASAASIGGSIAQSYFQNSIARSQRRVEQANAEARNTVRQGQNIQRVAESNLSALVRQLNNQRRQASTGEQIEAVGSTAIRAQEAFVSGQFEQGLRLSESLGAAAAQAAASGVGGSTVEAINSLVAGRAARLEQAQVEAQGRNQYDLYRQRAGILEAGIQSLDFSPLVANIDRGVDTAATGSSSFIGSLIGNLVGTDAQRKTLQTFLGSVSPAPQGVGSPPPFQALGSGFSNVGFVDGAQFFTQPAFSSIRIGGS